jgi:hypothetical protein
LDFPWLGKCCVLFLLDLYIYFGFPLARLEWSYLLKSVRLPLQRGCRVLAQRRDFNIKGILCSGVHKRSKPCKGKEIRMGGRHFHDTTLNTPSMILQC